MFNFNFTVYENSKKKIQCSFGLIENNDFVLGKSKFKVIVSQCIKKSIL